MKIETVTRLFTEMTDDEAQALLDVATDITMRGKGATIENPFIREWMDACFPDAASQFLLIVSTVFPARAFLSVIRHMEQREQSKAPVAAKPAKPVNPKKGYTLTTMDVFVEYCKEAKCWGLLLSNCGDADIESVQAAAPILSTDAAINLAAGGDIVFAQPGTVGLCYKTEQDAREAYGTIVGEDGPTASNPYKGPGRVYAALVASDGKIKTENT